MMIRVVVLSFILLFRFALVTAQTEPSIYLRGYILNLNDLTPVPLASIKTTISNTKYITSRKGFFYMKICKDDSLYITSIGYADVHLHVKYLLSKTNNDTILIMMAPKSYHLSNIDVIRSNHQRDSIARIVASILSRDSLLNNYDRIYNRPKGRIIVDSTGIIYAGIIQNLYNRFSKEGKENVKFEAFIQYAQNQKHVDERYDKATIKKLAGILDNEVDEFILFCNMSRNFILNASEYEFYSMIKKCGDNFKAQKAVEKKQLR